MSSQNSSHYSPSKRLTHFANGRDNNFNLIRFIAAFLVLFSHSFVLATGSGDAEPLRTTLGITWGDIAVDVFFVTSGFLVTSSLISRQSVIAFAWARALRIYPALWMMLLLTVFGMGFALTTDTPSAYLTSHVTWHYFLKNAILVKDVEYWLPGVFKSNPLRSVNGSIWSLTPEVYMYATLLALWLLAVIARTHRLATFRVLIVATAIVSGAQYFDRGSLDDPAHVFPRLAFMFFTGATFYVLRDLIALRRSVFLGLLVLTLLSTVQRLAFFFAFNLSVAYILMYTAYGFGGHIRAFNRIGDYSYGIYIYAFPVQQVIISLLPHISSTRLFTTSAALTLGLAILSWQLIEKRALKLKGALADRTIVWINSVYAPKPAPAE